MKLKIKDRWIGEDEPVYFIADIGANHDGNLARAKKLISLAKEAGADAAKFQHFRAEKIVSDYGFSDLKGHSSHQSRWGKPVFDVYREAELDRAWTQELVTHCEKEQIHFLTSPYDFDAIKLLDRFLPAYKIGSGDINWDEMLIAIAKRRKPIFLATGASNIDEVVHAVSTIRLFNKKIALMQCNTNYTASPENYKHISLNVLKSYGLLFPDLVLGLSDHTLGHATVLGAVALGARVIEKHFTDDNSRVGPDHTFAMNPTTWREMVERTGELLQALGSSLKKIEQNEQDTVVLQRRCVRAATEIAAGHLIKKSDLDILRPAPEGAMKPNEISKVIGKKATCLIKKGDYIAWEKIC